MKNLLKVGDEYIYYYLVPANKTVPHLYPELTSFQIMPEVFATGFLVGIVEAACMAQLQESLEESEGSLGININLSHISPTPPNMNIEIKIRIASLEGNKIQWEVEVFDELDLVSKGTHDRFVINKEKFKLKVDSKKSKIL